MTKKHIHLKKFMLFNPVNPGLLGNKSIINSNLRGCIHEIPSIFSSIHNQMYIIGFKDKKFSLEKYYIIILFLFYVSYEFWV